MAGTELVEVHADDPDQGPSGNVTYAFTGHVQRVYGKLFGVDANSGVIYLRTALDYEKSPSYHLTVTATDRGTPPSLPVSAKVSLVCLSRKLQFCTFCQFVCDSCYKAIGFF